MKPYYETELGKLYHGDCLEIMPQMETADALITDPVWPNNNISEFKHIDPYKLLGEALPMARCRRIVIHLGCDSDPRVLNSVPKQFPFIRSCWLKYARPHYKGRVLYGADIAYVFGEPPMARKGAFVLPGETVRTDNKGRVTDHSCERPECFVMFLATYFGGETNIDPFIGSGTTAVVCERLNRKWIGIEISEKYCEIAAQRIENERKQLKLF